MRAVSHQCIASPASNKCHTLYYRALLISTLSRVARERESTYYLLYPIFYWKESIAKKIIETSSVLRESHIMINQIIK